MSRELVGTTYWDREKTRDGPPGVRIRPFTMSDYDAVVDLWSKAGLGLRVGDSRSEIERKLAHDPELFLIADGQGRTGAAAVSDATSAIQTECGHAVIGSVIGAWDGRRGWIYHLAVHPNHRRSGIGRALLHEVEHGLAARGCARVDLLVRTDNRGAHAFYASLGYEASPELVPMGKCL